GAAEGLSSIMAFHVDPSLRAGEVGMRAGPITSSSDGFSIEVEGPGGHTARPHETVDVIHAAAKLVTDLPALLDRLVDARRPLTLVFGQVRGGHADNVIPTLVTLSGTCRTLDREIWERLPVLIERLAIEIVAPYGAKVTVRYLRGIPPVVNHAGVNAILENALVTVLGARAVRETVASLGAEDFSRYLEIVPGALVRLGVGIDGHSTDLHSAFFDLDETAIEVGIVGGAYSLIELLRAAAEPA
ncbi:MAG: amidohydrolase, partial [Acidimicrobiia bacterium]|nr:amidohydrolase [Acidimicrobiia bacterium]